MELLFYVAFCAAIGYYANSKGRSVVLWVLLAVLISPVISGIILALLKDKTVERDMSELQMDHQQLRDRVATDEKVNEMKFEQMQSQITSGSPTGQALDVQGHPLLDSEYRPCPFCKEPVKKDAILCRHCHQQIAGVNIELCPYCKEEIPSTVTVCPHCGSTIERSATSTTAEEGREQS